MMRSLATLALLVVPALFRHDELTAPAKYQRTSTRGDPCTVVVIWTKHKQGI